MRKIHVVGLALVAVFALSAMTASSAFAVSKLLAGGNEINALINVSVADELLLEDMKVFGKPDVLCSGAFDSNVEAGGVLGAIEEVLTLSGVLLSDPKGDLVECEAHSTCSNPTDLVAVNLPWKTELVLVGAVFVLLILNGGKGEPGYLIDCNAPLVGLIEDTCTGATGAILTNEAEGVLGEFSEANETITVPGNCTQGGAKEGLLQGAGVIKNNSGTGILSVSE